MVLDSNFFLLHFSAVGSIYRVFNGCINVNHVTRQQCLLQRDDQHVCVPVGVIILRQC